MLRLDQKWAAVIGSPIRHSLSPVLHRTAYEVLGLKWDFTVHEVSAQGLSGYLGSLGEDCVGLAVTMPNKQAIMPYLDSIDGLAKAVGAVNTVAFSASMMTGFNTDVHGIVETVKGLAEEKQLHLGKNKHAVILGTKATASSALAAAVTLGFDKISIVGRSFEGSGSVLLAAGRLGVDFDPVLWKHPARVLDVCKTADLLISTVPLQATEHLAQELHPKKSMAVLDVTYGDGKTPLGVAYTNADAVVLSPLAMLVHQGLAQVKLWSGLEAPFEPVYRAVLEAA